MRKDYKDISNQTFGKLTALNPIRVITKQGSEVFWNCLCICGKITTVRGVTLRNGNTKSCGSNLCRDYSHVKKLPVGDAALNRLIKTIKDNAKTRGINYNLTREDVFKITKQRCKYCNIEPSQSVINSNKKSNLNGDYIYNGIDRLNNNLGYTVENLVPCCGVCNKMKLDYTADFFIKHIKKIYDNNI